jgi:hypothetical protein
MPLYEVTVKKVQKLWKDIQEQIGEAKKWSIFGHQT